jgi:hypothetical protein
MKFLITIITIICAFTSFAQDTSFINRRIDVEYFFREQDSRPFDGDYSAYQIILNHSDSSILLERCYARAMDGSRFTKTTHKGKFVKELNDTFRILYLTRAIETSEKESIPLISKLLKPSKSSFINYEPYLTVHRFWLKDSKIVFEDYFYPTVPKSAIPFKRKLLGNFN